MRSDAIMIYGSILLTSIVHGAVLELLAINDTTYFQTRQLSGQQYGLDYNLQNNYTTAYFDKFSSRPRTLFDWNSPSALEEKTEIQNRNNNGLSREKPVTIHDLKNSGNKDEETEWVENNVWWPWKNYDDWLNGRGLKAEHPKKKEEKKTDKEKKNRRKKKKKKNGKNGKTEKRRKKPKTEEKRPLENVNTVEVNNDLQLTVYNNNDSDEMTKKVSIPKIRYNASPIDIILRNRSLVPALVKYSSRNYTYDVNECLTNNGGCEGLCINTPGSYRCHCPPGFMVADTKCEDVDECLLRNGHGPCQGACSNTWGGYRCSCRGVPGTRLSGDGHTCDDVDECRDGTAGCSHQCINTVGSAFCVCPDGLRLDDDWKTCVDVDECADPELQQPPDRCADLGMACMNTHGSYACG